MPVILFCFYIYGLIKSSFQLVHTLVHRKTTQHLGSNFQIYGLLDLIDELWNL